MEEGFVFWFYLCLKEFNKFPDLQLTLIKKWRVELQPSETLTQAYCGLKLCPNWPLALPNCRDYLLRWLLVTLMKYFSLP